MWKQISTSYVYFLYFNELYEGSLYASDWLKLETVALNNFYFIFFKPDRTVYFNHCCPGFLMTQFSLLPVCSEPVNKHYWEMSNAVSMW